MVSPAGAAPILIVEDDRIVREIITAHLAAHAMQVISVADSRAALAVTEPYDLALVDINLPDGSGFELVEKLRARRDCGVIFITSLDGVDNRVRGLESGGDDYIVKPVEGRELVARVRAVLRRYRRPQATVAESRAEMRVVDLDGWTMDFVRRELVAPDASPARLTRAEFDLLAALVQAAGTTLSRDYLLEVVASVESATKSRTIDVMVSRIRRKLAAMAPRAPTIETAKREGYRFSPVPR